MGRHCSCTDWREHMAQCTRCSSPLCTVWLGRQAKARIEILVEFHVSETHPKVELCGSIGVSSNLRLTLLRMWSLLHISLPIFIQSCESREELEVFPQKGLLRKSSQNLCSVLTHVLIFQRLQIKKKKKSYTFRQEGTNKPVTLEGY